ncbi:MAG: DinB superfamily protein [Acidobacteria bacterium OLB17]|nr:MAG: DinB superfamily protein [Acidobacteria bacterium OLB17]MCZ2390412.1 DinB family protein [Acidobacteriota bacterium]
MFKLEPTEYAPAYGNYIALVPEDDIRDAYAKQADELRSVFKGLPEDRGAYAYDAGKWTIKEVLSHLIDCERIFSYRMLRFSRGDETPLATFDQEDSGYTLYSNANGRSFADLLDEFAYVRAANTLMLNNMDEAALKRVGVASGNPISVRALARICVGHVRHHVNVLKDRYLAG